MKHILSKLRSRTTGQRLVVGVAALAAAASSLVILAPPAQSAVSMSYCTNTAYYPNSLAGLRWAGGSFNYWMTVDRLTAGNCGRVFVKHLAVYGAPSSHQTAQYRLVTYLPGGEINWQGSFSRCLDTGENVMLKDNVSKGRRFRIHARICGAPGVPYDISFLVAAGDRTR